MRAASRPRRLPTDRTSDRVAHPRPSAMAGGPWYGHRRRANPGHLAAVQTALSKATPSAMRGTRVSIGPEYAWPSTTISALPAGPPRTCWHRWQFRRPSQGAAPRPQRRVAEYPGGYDGRVGSLTWPLRLFSVRLEILVVSAVGRLRCAQWFSSRRTSRNRSVVAGFFIPIAIRQRKECETSMKNHEVPALMGRPAFGLPKPHGWTLERTLHLMAGTAVLSTLALGRAHSPRWRVVTGFVGANLLLDAAVGWCPTSLLLHRLGIPTAGERAMRSGGTASQTQQ